MRLFPFCRHEFRRGRVGRTLLPIAYPSDILSVAAYNRYTLDDIFSPWKELFDNSLRNCTIVQGCGDTDVGALWEKHINKILDDLDIVYTIQEVFLPMYVCREGRRFCTDKSTTSYRGHSGAKTRSVDSIGRWWTSVKSNPQQFQWYRDY
jgi:hypothetical protein